MSDMRMKTHKQRAKMVLGFIYPFIYIPCFWGIKVSSSVLTFVRHELLTVVRVPAIHLSGALSNPCFDVPACKKAFLLNHETGWSLDDRRRDTCVRSQRDECGEAALVQQCKYSDVCWRCSLHIQIYCSHLMSRRLEDCLN